MLCCVIAGPLATDPYTLYWGNAYNDSYGDNHCQCYTTQSHITPLFCPSVLPLTTCHMLLSVYVVSGYNYDADCSDVTVFPRSRFISEFGWQSLPSFYTWQQISEPSDWSYRSPLSLFRQHHEGGYDQMEAGIRRYFNWPNSSDSVQLFNDTIYMTQVHQSYCYSQGINHWRRIKQESPGNTMGMRT